MLPVAASTEMLTNANRFWFAAKSLLALAVCLISSRYVLGQESAPDQRPRLLIGADFGLQNQLGYFPTATLSTGFEVPIGHRFELQTISNYAIARKFITGDGQSAHLGGSLIAWTTNRVGLFGSVEQSWLWTSQFDKSNLFPSVGIVLRGHSLGPGRIYLSYLIPTGCVWATSSNPCKIQSNQLQGFQFRKEGRLKSRLRWLLGFSVLHFCDQANPYEPQTGRNCHMALTGSGGFRFEVPIFKRSNNAYDFY
jgi:hypothetical protein